MDAETKAALVGQPIGYWAGEAYRRVSARLIASLREAGLSQPQWWVLGRVDDSTRSWTRDELINELQPYSDVEEGRSVAAELDELADRAAVRVVDERLVITPTGSELLEAARANNGAAHRAMRSQLSDDEYAAMIDGLQKIVGALDAGRDS